MSLGLDLEQLITFENTYKRIVKLIWATPSMKENLFLRKWVKEMLDYNVPHGKKIRGLMVIHSYRAFEDPNAYSNEKLEKAFVLAWCIEMLQASFLIADDIMDGSITRRKQLCWYKKDDLGIAAFIDSLMLENLIYVVIKHYFKDDPSYVNIMEIFSGVTLKTSYGQSVDTRIGLAKDLNLFTMDLYEYIVKYKTSFYTLYLPVLLGKELSTRKDEKWDENCIDLIFGIGSYFQIQDDFLDCFGDERKTGKKGTDIADYKCSWLVVKALERANKEQKEILIENYGKGTEDEEKVKMVKKLYEEMEIDKIYEDFEKQKHDEIVNKSKLLNSEVAGSLFLKVLDMLNMRKS